MASQDQNIDHSNLDHSQIQQNQAGRDAISFLNSNDNQVIIENTFLRLFGTSESTQVDWDWGKHLLEKKQLPEIRQRLTDTLGRDRIFMDVAIAEQPSWVNRSPLEADRRLQINGKDCGILDPNKLLIETFGRDDIGGKLLILGVPGAGKTTALLSLAEQLVCGALVQPKTVIPALFELSTWRDDNQSIHDWLIEQLYDLHGGDRKYKRYEQWLERQILLPLLDGLDELGLERQEKCTVKLNEFARNYPQMVVCCRVKEFETVNIKLRYLKGAVCLQPLADGQIEAYLHSIHRSELWSAMQTNPALQALLKTTPEGDPGLLRVPLFVKLTADVYDPNEPIRSKKDLIEKYIERQLSFDQRERDRRKELERRDWAYKTVEAEPKLQETISSLSWIARQLQANNTVELLIEQMQPSWIESKGERRLYGLSFGQIVGLIFGLIFWLFGGLIMGPIWGLIGSFIIWIILGTILGIIFWLIGELGNELILALLSVFVGWIIFGIILGSIFVVSFGLKAGLIGGVIVGLIFGLIFGLIVWLIGQLRTIESVESFQFSILNILSPEILSNLKFGLISGLKIGLGSGLIIGTINILSKIEADSAIELMYGLKVGVTGGMIVGLILGLIIGLKQELNMCSCPNQGMWNSLRNMLWTTLVSYPISVFGVMVELVVSRATQKGVQNFQIIFRDLTEHELELLLLVGLLIAVTIGFSVGGGKTCLQHLSLRLVLWQSGTIPWNFARFLNYCVERSLLFRIGGRYRFLHRELLDHFAQSNH